MYLLKYKILNDVYNPPKIDDVISIESFNFRSVFKFLKDLLKQVATFFKKVYVWIKAKVMKYLDLIFKSKSKFIRLSKVVNILPEDKFNKLVDDSIKLYRKTNVNQSLEGYDDNDFDIAKYLNGVVVTKDNQDILIDYLSKYKVDYLTLLLNNNPLVDDFDNAFNLIKDTINDFLGNKNYAENTIGTIEDASKRFKPYIGDINSNQIKINISSMDLFKHIDKLDEITRRYRGYSGDVERMLSKRITELDNAITRISFGEDEEGYYNHYDNYRREMNLLKMIINLSTVPYSLCLQYIRFLSVLSNKFKESEYISTNVPPHTPLYHLSFDGELDRKGFLKPELRLSGLAEFLPKRVSFAPTIEQCAYAIENQIKHLMDQYDYPGYFDIYLYEGLPNKDTRYIVDELMRTQIHDYGETSEVAVIMPIKIVKRGLYRIYPNLVDFGGKDAYTYYEKIS